jgi:hypothetical protein
MKTYRIRVGERYVTESGTLGITPEARIGTIVDQLVMDGMSELEACEEFALHATRCGWSTKEKRDA